MTAILYNKPKSITILGICLRKLPAKFGKDPVNKKTVNGHTETDISVETGASNVPYKILQSN